VSGASTISNTVPPDRKGLHWITTGAGLGLAAGTAALAVPASLLLLAAYSPGALLRFGPTLIAAASALALMGTVLFAVSLIAFRTGFARFRKSARHFWSASALCLVGTAGYVLLILPLAIAVLSSETIFRCVQGSPALALSCIQAVAPLAGYSAILAFWLVWVGQLGIVVGLVLTSRRYRSASLYIGTVLYGLLILLFIAPFLGLVFSISTLTYALIAVAILGILAPAFVAHGSAHPFEAPVSQSSRKSRSILQSANDDQPPQHRQPRESAPPVSCQSDGTRRTDGPALVSSQHPVGARGSELEAVLQRDRDQNPAPPTS